MLTIFSTPKPFVGHNNIIQRNAIKSWTLLHPDIEIILFGEEEGAAEVCKEYNIRHEPVVRRSPSGVPYLNHIFEEAQRMASHPVTCYVNCDVVLMSDFSAAVSAISAKHQRFLMIGQRWETPITQVCSFSGPTWQVDLQKFAREHGRPAGPHSIDYFVFPRGLYDRLPPLIVGRGWWDHWMVWKARNLGAAVVDATATVMAIHQSHDYSHYPGGLVATFQGEEALENIRLAGGRRHLCTLLHATHRLTSQGERRSWGGAIRPYRDALSRATWAPWYWFLGLTGPIRHRLGLRKGFLAKAMGKDARPGV